jgi:asparagine synthase (glutamine-hydrolysing)
MSGICGIFYLDGQPATRENLAAMMAAMSYWGPDGSGVWREGPVGLGHLLLHNTPESLHEHLPHRDEVADLVITAHARIDNREELIAALGVLPPEHPALPDSALILKAYEKWGEDCPDRLLGDWCFAIWDARNRKLFLARDQHGTTGLYFHANARFFAFASSFKGMLALPEVPRRLNELRIAQILVSWAEEGQATCYLDIRRLPPAHALTVTPAGTRVRRYWHLEATPPLRLGSDEQYVEAFRDLYAEAVRCRLRSLRPVGVMLSGGLDSGSVAALAARELLAQGQRLPAFSSVPFYDTAGLVKPYQFGDERPFIEATRRQAGNLEVTYSRAEQVSPLEGIRRALILHDEPGHAAANYYWMVALLEKARARDIGALLTGQGGNATVSWEAPGYLAALARGGHWQTLRKELIAWKSVHQRPLWRAFAGQVLKPLLAPWLSCRYRLFPHGQAPWADYAAIHPQFARRLRLLEQMGEREHDPTFPRSYPPNLNSRESRYEIILPGASLLGCVWQELGAGFGMEVRDPTLDKRLLEFCLAIPDDQHFRNGWNRWLLRRALEGLLPPTVLGNTRRGVQAADIGWRLRDSWQEVGIALEKLEKSPLASNYLTIDKMKNILYKLQNRIDQSITWQCGTILLRGLMVGLFLLRFEEENAAAGLDSWGCWRTGTHRGQRPSPRRLPVFPNRNEKFP